MEVDELMETLKRAGLADELPGQEGQQAGQEKQDQGAADKGQASGGEGGEDWKSAIANLQKQVTDQNQDMQARLVTLLGELARQNNQKAAPTQLAPGGQPAEGEATPEKLAEWWRAQADMPQLGAALVDRQVASALSQREKALMGKIQQMLDQRDVEHVLSSSVNRNYGEAIRDPNSPLTQGAVEARRMLAKLLRPELVDSDVHLNLAVLLSGGQNPGYVAKREVDRAKAQMSKRDELVNQLSALARSTGRAGSAGDVNIDAEDEKMAARFGIDLNKPEVRERILASKREVLKGMHSGFMPGPEFA